MVILKSPCADLPCQSIAQTSVSALPSSTGLSTPLLPGPLDSHAAAVTRFPSVLFHFHFSCKVTFLLREEQPVEFAIVFEDGCISLLLLKDASALYGILDGRLFSWHINSTPWLLVFCC